MWLYRGGSRRAVPPSYARGCGQAMTMRHRGRLMRFRKGLRPTVVALALCCGCAAQTSARSACAPVPDEFSLAGQAVYRDCGVDQKARLQTGLPRLHYRPAAGQSCVRAAIDVVVDADGRPVRETARVVRATDPNLAAAMLISLDDMRYEPALKDGRPVPQLVRVERTVAVRIVAVPAGTSPSSVRPPRGGPPC
jgi:hypothetical protein